MNKRGVLFVFLGVLVIFGSIFLIPSSNTQMQHLEVGRVIQSSETFDIILQAPPTSFEIDGSLISGGEARIFAIHDGTKYLVYDSNRSPVIGKAVADCTSHCTFAPSDSRKVSLEILVSNAIFSLDALSYAIYSPNTPPRWRGRNVFIIRSVDKYSIDLSRYFQDPDNQTLRYKVESDMNVEIKNGSLIYYPEEGDRGINDITVFAHDGFSETAKDLIFYVYGDLPQPKALTSKIESGVEEEIYRKAKAKVIVVLKETEEAIESGDQETKEKVEQSIEKRKGNLHGVKKKILDELVVDNSTLEDRRVSDSKRVSIIAAAVLEPVAELTITQDYETLNVIAGEVTQEGLDKLEQNDLVEKIYLDPTLGVNLQDSVELINAKDLSIFPEEGEIKLTGSSQSVCLLDTGVDSDHVALKDNIIASQCFCSISDLGEGGCCDNGEATDVVAEDDSLNSHGTHVAGIVVSNGNVRGVAPGANIVAVKVCDFQGKCLGSDILAGIDYCNSNSQALNVSVISGSLSDSGEYDVNSCPDPFDNSFEVARQLKISTVFAAGNNFHERGISYPACSPYTISVGASDKNNVEAEFSNSGDLLDVLAPGVDITSTTIGNRYAGFSGTSQSTPHVAAAIALIKQRNSLMNISKNNEEVKASLKQTLVSGVIDVLGAINLIDSITIKETAYVTSGISETGSFGVTAAPYNATIHSPVNGTSLAIPYRLLNFTVTDPEGTPMNVTIYGGNTTNSTQILYFNSSVANGSIITYNWTAPLVNESAPGVFALYHLENTSSDATVHAHTLGSLNGSCFVEQGKFGRGYNVKKNNCDLSSVTYNSLTNAETVNFNTSGKITLAMWDRIERNSSSGVVEYLMRVTYARGAGSNGYIRAYHHETNNLTYLTCYNGSDALTTSGTNLGNLFGGNVWRHSAFTYERLENNTSNLSFYRDGDLKITYNCGNLLMPEFDVNRVDFGSQNGGNPLNATIDELAVWNRTLSHSEIKDLFRLANGTYYWRVNTTDTTGSNLTLNFEFNVGDTVNVTFELPSPADKLSLASNFGPVNINLTVISNTRFNVDTCIIEWNGVNSTMQKNSTGKNVLCNSTQLLSQRTNNYKLFLNDTLNNVRVLSRIVYNNTAPDNATLLSPLDKSIVETNVPTLLVKVTDADSDNVSAKIFGYREGQPEELLYYNPFVANGSSISYVWKGTPVVNSTDLQQFGIYRLNNESGLDDSGNGRTLLSVNNSCFVSDGKFGIAYNISCDLDTLDYDTQLVERSGFNSSGEITVSIWENRKGESPRAHQEHPMAINIANGPLTTAYVRLYLHKTLDNWYITCHNGSSTYSTNAISANLGGNGWHHSALAYARQPDNTSLVSYYRDGELKTIFDCGGMLMHNFDVLDLNFGNYNGNRKINGTIDDIGVWNRTLRAEEIKSIATSLEDTYTWRVQTNDSYSVNNSNNHSFTIDLPEIIGGRGVVKKVLESNDRPITLVGVTNGVEKPYHVRAREGDKFIFTIKTTSGVEGEHSVSLNEVSSSGLTVTVRSSPITKTIRPGRFVTADVDKDGKDDLKIGLSILDPVDKIVTMKITLLTEAEVEETEDEKEDKIEELEELLEDEIVDEDTLLEVQHTLDVEGSGSSTSVEGLGKSPAKDVTEGITNVGNELIDAISKGNILAATPIGLIVGVLINVLEDDNLDVGKCVDSDAANDKFTSGSVKYDGNVNADTCFNGGSKSVGVCQGDDCRLVEYFCEDDVRGEEEYKCHCDAGKCLVEGKKALELSLNLEELSLELVNEYSCEDSDSDEKDQYMVRGKVIEKIDEEISKEIEDECKDRDVFKDKDVLIEAICQEDTAQTKEKECTEGYCDEGRCVQEEKRVGVLDVKGIEDFKVAELSKDIVEVIGVFKKEGAVLELQNVPDLKRDEEPNIHKITLDEIDFDNKKVVITFENDPQGITLVEGQTKNIDLDSDDEDDILFILKSIEEDGDVEISVKIIKKVITESGASCIDHDASDDPRINNTIINDTGTFGDVCLDSHHVGEAFCGGDTSLGSYKKIICGDGYCSSGECVKLPIIFDSKSLPFEDGKLRVIFDKTDAALSIDDELLKDYRFIYDSLDVESKQVTYRLGDKLVVAKEGDVEKIDLDGDGVSDVEVDLKKISEDGELDVTVKVIEPEEVEDISYIVLKAVKETAKAKLKDRSSKVVIKELPDNVEEHIVTLKEVKEEAGGISVILTFTSDPQDVEFKEGETKKIDLDGDGNFDIEVTIDRIEENGVAFTTEALGSEDVVESEIELDVSCIDNVDCEDGKICQNGLCVKKEESLCSDPDGLDFGLRSRTFAEKDGKVTSEATDYCSLGDRKNGIETLVEHKCVDNRITQHRVTCEEGEVCREGACIEEGVCEDPDNDDPKRKSKVLISLSGQVIHSYEDSCEDSSVKEWVCEGSEANSIKQPCEHGCLEGVCLDAPVYECRDDDSGLVLDKSTSAAKYEDGTVQTRIFDGCVDENTVNEAVCVSGSHTPVYEEKSCAEGVVCFEGACVSRTCEDTDGNNLKEKGKIVQKLEGEIYASYEDNCVDNKVKEWTCDGSAMFVEEKECEFGCSDGVCKDEPETIMRQVMGAELSEIPAPVKIVVEPFVAINKIMREYVETSPEYIEEIPGCQDSDGGIVRFERGVVEVGGEKIHDSCKLWKLYEGVCLGGDLNEGSGLNENIKVIDCKYGCENGACAKNKLCEDSDGGIDKFRKGEVKDKDGLHQDTCYKQTGTTLFSTTNCLGEDCFVEENYCLENALKLVKAKCPAGCVGGACLPEKEDIVESIFPLKINDQRCEDSDDSGKITFLNTQSRELYEKGESTEFLNDEINKKIEDDCIDVSTLKESICVDNTAQTKEVKCPTDTHCSEGACIKNIDRCLDSDEDGTSSLRLNVKGNVVQYVNGESTKILIDECIDSTTLSESVCVSGITARQIEADCPAGTVCSDGACSAPSITCADSDDEDKSDVRGEVTEFSDDSVSKIVKDQCFDEHSVLEATCVEKEQGTFAGTAKLNCLLGSRCIEGACTRNEVVCENSFDCRNGEVCFDNVCRNANDKVCEDKDGVDPSIYSETKVYTIADGPVNGLKGSGRDICSSIKDNIHYLFESTCVGDKIESRKIACGEEEICQDGACVGSICTDTDEDNDIFMKGTVKITLGDKELGSREDTCIRFPTHKVRQNFCTPEGHMSFSTEPCGNGNLCSGGACVQHEEVCNDPDGKDVKTKSKATLTVNGEEVSSNEDYCFLNNPVMPPMLSEAICNGDKLSFQEIFCEDGEICKGGKCVPKSLPGCTDSDGFDKYTVGSVRYNGETKTDECSGSSRIKEYFCADRGSINSMFLYCDPGEVCNAGKCTDAGPRYKKYLNLRHIAPRCSAEVDGSGNKYTPPCTADKTIELPCDLGETAVWAHAEVSKRVYYDFPISRVDGNTGFFYLKSANNAQTKYIYGTLSVLCEKVPGREKICFDSDAGPGSSSVRGTAKLIKDNRVTTSIDTCNTQRKLVEQTCKGNDVVKDIIDCPGGRTCVEGMCENLDEPRYCTDSDDGVEPNIKGVVEIKSGEGYYASKSVIREDHCVGEGTVVEHQCHSDWYRRDLSGTKIDCASGKVCKDGACVDK